MDILDIAKMALGDKGEGGDQTTALLSGLVQMLAGGSGSPAAAGKASGMPGLGDLVGALGAGGGGSGSGGGAAGLAALVQMFAGKGLGDIVNSWVSTGQNLPISAEQLQQALGRDRVAQLAAGAGLSHEAALGQLTQLLPSVVDKLTPNGAIQEESLLEQGLNLLNSLKK